MCANRHGKQSNADITGNSSSSEQDKTLERIPSLVLMKGEHLKRQRFFVSRSGKHSVVNPQFDIMYYSYVEYVLSGESASVFTSTTEGEGGYVFTPFCLSVCLCAGYLKKLWTDLDEIL